MVWKTETWFQFTCNGLVPSHNDSPSKLDSEIISIHVNPFSVKPHGHWVENPQLLLAVLQPANSQSNIRGSTVFHRSQSNPISICDLSNLSHSVKRPNGLNPPNQERMKPPNHQPEVGISWLEMLKWSAEILALPLLPTLSALVRSWDPRRLPNFHTSHGWQTFHFRRCWNVFKQFQWHKGVGPRFQPVHSAGISWARLRHVTCSKFSIPRRWQNNGRMASLQILTQRSSEIMPKLTTASTEMLGPRKNRLQILDTEQSTLCQASDRVHVHDLHCLQPPKAHSPHWVKDRASLKAWDSRVKTGWCGLAAPKNIHEFKNMGTPNAEFDGPQNSKTYELHLLHLLHLLIAARLHGVSLTPSQKLALSSQEVL